MEMNAGCDGRKGCKHELNKDADEKRAKTGRPYYMFTKHAMERFQERFRNKFRDLDWNRENAVKRRMLELLFEAAENNSFRNNHRFMDNIYSKYGYDEKFKFMCNGGITFVVVPKPERNNETIVTCFDGTHDRFVTRHKKFKKKKNPQNNLDFVNDIGDVVDLNLVDLDDAKAMGWNIGLNHAKSAKSAKSAKQPDEPDNEDEGK